MKFVSKILVLMLVGGLLSMHSGEAKAQHEGLICAATELGYTAAAVGTGYACALATTIPFPKMSLPAL